MRNESINGSVFLSLDRQSGLDSVRQGRRVCGVGVPEKSAKGAELFRFLLPLASVIVVLESGSTCIIRLVGKK